MHLSQWCCFIGHIFYSIVYHHVQHPWMFLLVSFLDLISIDVIYISNASVSFSNFLCFHAHAGATNKPQELDDAVLRRLVSICHECAATQLFWDYEI